MLRKQIYLTRRRAGIFKQRPYVICLYFGMTANVGDVFGILSRPILFEYFYDINMNFNLFGKTESLTVWFIIAPQRQENLKFTMYLPFIKNKQENIPNKNLRKFFQDVRFTTL